VGRTEGEGGAMFDMHSGIETRPDDFWLDVVCPGDLADLRERFIDVMDDARWERVCGLLT